jgi:argininosuccinate synthase
MKSHAVLAYSGGLDTSYCLVYLTKVKQIPVHTVIVNTGGFSSVELDQLEDKALKFGAKKHIVINAEHAYYEKGIRYLIFGNVLRNHTYPLSVGAERVFHAQEVAHYAKKTSAGYLVHGSTGAGNDQVRFDMIFMTMAPEIPILTPVRDQNLSRQQEIEFLNAQGFDLAGSQSKYSINQGLWGTSVGGSETLTSHQELPDRAFPTKITKTGTEKLTLGFSSGELSEINGRKVQDPVAAINKINTLAGSYGIGRDIHIGDTIIGIKGRVGFAAAAAITIIKAHEALEKHVLSKWQIYWKEQLANWYGQLLHEGNYLDPVMRNIETFLQDTQKTVTGRVHLRMYPRHINITGVESHYDLINRDFAAYGESSGDWSGDDVRGFARIASLSNKIYHKINPESEIPDE